MIDLNHGQSEARTLSSKISGLIQAGQKAAAADQQPRKYLGASGLGGSCERAVQLDYIRSNGLPSAPEPLAEDRPTTQRIFDFGHSIEDLAIGWLRTAGFDVRTRKADGEQFGFAVAGGRFRGHIDGVIVAGPDLLAYPCLFEHKALGNKSWQETAKKGVEAAKPGYCGQCQIYMAYLDLAANPALFMATNRDSGEVYCEAVPFDGAMAQKLSDRAVRILQSTDAGELLPKAFSSADVVDCKMCRWRGFCWPAGQ